MKANRNTNKFKVGDKVIFDNQYYNEYSDNQDVIMLLSKPYLTISKITMSGSYELECDPGGSWAGMYWKLYKDPCQLPEDLFTL